MSTTFIIDTREQKPFEFKNSVRKKLEVGDYTTKKLHGKFHVERKSVIDLYGSITKGHLRFKKEIIRAKHYAIELIVMVEGTRQDLYHKRFYKGSERKMDGETLLKIVDTIQRKHGIAFKFYASRASCHRAMVRLLKQKESLRIKRLNT